jgi:hypothetical protein
MNATRFLGRLGVAALSVLLCAGVPALAADDDSIRFHDNYADAIREAKATGKPIFLEFRCAP